MGLWPLQQALHQENHFAMWKYKGKSVKYFTLGLCFGKNTSEPLDFNTWKINSAIIILYSFKISINYLGNTF